MPPSDVTEEAGALSIYERALSCSESRSGHARKMLNLSRGMGPHTLFGEPDGASNCKKPHDDRHPYPPRLSILSKYFIPKIHY